MASTDDRIEQKIKGLIPGSIVFTEDFQSFGSSGAVAVALHRMDENFDTGPVLMLERLQSQHDMSLVTLRYYTTLLAIDMCVTMLQQLASGVDIESKPQQPCEGKYYSYVPWLLKPLADWRLRRFARREKHGK